MLVLLTKVKVERQSNKAKDVKRHEKTKKSKNSNLSKSKANQNQDQKLSQTNNQMI